MKKNLEIESVIGITCASPFSLLSMNDGVVCYPAGATTILYNFEQNLQVAHLISPIAPKSISCLSRSVDGNYLAIGETGHQPRILLYDINNAKWMTSLSGHKYGVKSAQFSPDMRFLVSVGYQHDGFLYLWDWRSGRKLAGAKITVSLYSLSFDSSSRFFVTAGVKHIKFWDLAKVHVSLMRQIKPETEQLHSVTNQASVVTLEGKSGILGEHKAATIVDVVCGRESDNSATCHTYAITADGVLMMFNEAGVLEKWLNTKIERGSCILATDQLIICGGSDGKIRIFQPVTLAHIANMPLPDPLFNSLTESKIEIELPRVFPQVVAMQLSTNLKLIVLYSNRNLVIYDISKQTDVAVSRNIKHHADCIWGVQAFSSGLQSDTSIETDGFITYSSDGSVRFWDSDSLKVKTETHRTPTYYTTLLADPKGLMKFQYLDRSGSSNDIKSVTERTGIRALAIDPSRKLIACGDRNGTIGIFLFDTFEKLATIEAHDAEIMCLDFAVIGVSDTLVLASASRDRLIHVFDASQVNNLYPFDLIQTLDDHSSTLTSMMFADSGSKLISCGADKAVIFRSLQDDQNLHFATFRNTPLRSTVYDMTLAQVARLIITASQDRRITQLDIDSGKPGKSFATTIQPLDSSIKANPFLNTLTTDPTGSIICAGASDKSIHLIDSQTGHTLFQGVGHGDLVTSVEFINQGSHVVSTSADGCIFIWKVPESVLRKMGFLPRLTSVRPSTPETLMSPVQNSPGSVFRFEEMHLPGWARSEGGKGVEVEMPSMGRWAERVNQKEGIKLFSENSEDVVVAKSELYRKYSVEVASPVDVSAIVESLDLDMDAVEQIGLDVDVVGQVEVEGSRVEMVVVPQNERLGLSPFADEIESDSEGGEREEEETSVLSFSSLTSNGADATIESDPTTPEQAKKATTTIFSQLRESVVGAVESVLHSSSSVTENSRITRQELAQFKALAVKLSSALSEGSDPTVLETVQSVALILKTALGDDERPFDQDLLEKYSDRLLDIVSKRMDKI